jgi:hypothetical protein
MAQRWRTDSPGRSAAERGNQIGRISKIPPLPRPALIPGLAPLRGEAVQRRHESIDTRHLRAIQLDSPSAPDELREAIGNSES